MIVAMSSLQDSCDGIIAFTWRKLTTKGHAWGVGRRIRGGGRGLCGTLPGAGDSLPPQRGEVAVLTGWWKSLGPGTTCWGLGLELGNLSVPALLPQFLPLLPLGKVVWVHSLLRGVPVVQAPLWDLVALISFIGGPSRRIREEVWLWVLVGPEFFLPSLQHHGSFHHVLLMLVLIEASTHRYGIEAVLVPENAP